jgi:hypothetical protein
MVSFKGDKLGRIRTRWVEALAAVDAVVAGLLVVVGVYLIDPTLADLGFYIEAGRYALVGGFLIYAAIVLAYAAVFTTQTADSGLVAWVRAVVLGGFALLATASIHLALAVQALLAEPMPNWVALLAIPGVLSLLTLFSTSLERARAVASGEAGAPQTTADSGKTDTAAVVRGHLLAGAIAAIGSVLIVAYLGAGIFLYYLLKAILIDGAQINLAFVLSRALPWLVERLWPFALGISLFVLIAMLVTGWAHAAQHRRARRRRPDIDRDLSPGEIAFVSESVARIGEHIEQNGLRPLARRLRTVFAISAVSFFGGAFALMFAAEALVAWLYRPPGEGWHFYLADGPLLMLGALIGVGSWGLMPTAAMALLSRRYAEASGVLALGGVSGMRQVEARIVKFVRLGTLSPAKPFDPSVFLRGFGLAGPLLTVAWVLPVSAVLAFAWPYDRALDIAFSDEAIVTGDFWTTTRTVYPYAALEAIELECRFAGNGDTDVGYTIVLPGKRKRRLVNAQRLGAHLDDFVKVDEKLRAAGVPAVFALPEEGASRAAVVDRMCVIEISEDMSEADRARVERLFHLDEWFERRWRWRTRQPQISSS